MGKTVRFEFPSATPSTTISSPTTTTAASKLSSSTIRSSSSSSLYRYSFTSSPSSSVLTNCFMSTNNNNLNNKMFNGNNNNNNNYSRLLSSTSRIPTTQATASNYNAIYPSSALEDQPTSSLDQDSTGNIERVEGELYGDIGSSSDAGGAAAGCNGSGGGDDDDIGEGEGRSSSRNNLLSSRNTIDYDSMTEVVIDELAETEPTSAILDFCKRKFLRLYLNLLGLAGIYPTSSDTSCFRLCMSYLQTVIILTILLFGYYMQYRSSFRRDRGFSVNSSTILTSTIVLSPNYREALDFGDILFVHIIPSSLHLFGFIFAVYVFRIADNEQLQNLVERVFLLSNRPKRLCVILWLHVVVGFFVLALFTGYVILLVYSQPENLQLGMFVVPGINVHYASRVGLVALILTTFTQDAIQMTVLSAYCIECYLLRLHLRNLKEKLMQHTIETIDWMREVLEFRKLLNHLNKKVSIPVCFFTIMNLTYAFAGLVYVFKEYDFNCPIKIFLLNFGNVILWLIIGLIPFFQAAAVTRGCQSTQYSGHQIRVRPFVYHNTPSSDLDSTLLFASSLQMSAKLFHMPIQTNYLYFSILIISIIILTLGMCLNISLGLTSN